MTDGLKDAHREAIIAVIAANDRVERAVLFGSRATGTNTVTSDVDIALFGDRLTLTDQARLSAVIDQIPMAQSVDLLLYDSIQDRALREHIRRRGAEWYARPDAGGTGANPHPPSTWDVWPSMSLREVGVSLIDCEHRTPPASENGYSYIGIPQVKDGRIDPDGARCIAQEHYREWTRRAKPQPFDIVLSRRCNPGETGFVSPGFVEFALGQNLVLLRSDGKKVFKPFLRWLVRSPRWWAEVSKFINVGAVFDSLKCADIPGFQLPIPTRSEQRAIAHILGTLDDKIELNRRMNETLEAMARALFKSWFVDFDPVRAKMEGRDTGLPQDIADLLPDRLVDSEMGEIPEGWEVATLGTVIELHDRKRIPLNKGQRADRQGSYPYYGAAGVLDYVDGYLFDGVHILTGEDGSVVDAHGHPVVQYVWGRFWVNNHAHVIKGTKDISDEHLYLHLKSTNITPFVTGAVQPKLNQKNLKAIPLVVPADSTSRAFSRLVAPLFAIVRHNADQSRLLPALRDGLLPKLISGEMRVSRSAPNAEGTDRGQAT